MSRNIDVQDLTPVVADDEDALEKAKCDGRNREEIDRRNRFSMVSQECAPALCRFGISRCSAHPARNGPFGNFEPEHE